MALRPAGCVLIELRDVVEHRLAEGMADQLQGERQAALGEARRNDQAGLASDIERHAGLAPVIGSQRLVIVNAAGGIRARGGYRQVDVRKVLRYPVAKLEAPPHRLKVIDGAAIAICGLYSCRRLGSCWSRSRTGTGMGSKPGSTP